MKIGCICYFVGYFPLATYGILMKGIRGLNKSTHLYLSWKPKIFPKMRIDSIWFYTTEWQYIPSQTLVYFMNFALIIYMVALFHPDVMCQCTMVRRGDITHQRNLQYSYKYEIFGSFWMYYDKKIAIKPFWPGFSYFDKLWKA